MTPRTSHSRREAFDLWQIIVGNRLKGQFVLPERCSNAYSPGIPIGPNTESPRRGEATSQMRKLRLSATSKKRSLLVAAICLGSMLNSACAQPAAAAEGKTPETTSTSQEVS